VSEAAARRAPSRAWLLVVVLMVGLAVAGPAIIVRDRLAAADAPAAVAAAGQAQPAGGAGGATVKMAGLAFNPAELQVAPGTTVVFDNDDTAPHTVTARSGGTDSGVLDPGKQFSVAVSEGFDYFCSIHPSMTAKVVVTG
jgi:plastocyanin